MHNYGPIVDEIALGKGPLLQAAYDQFCQECGVGFADWVLRLKSILTVKTTLESFACEASHSFSKEYDLY